MKTLLTILLTLIVFTPAFAQNDVTLSVCMYPDGMYQFAYTGHIESYSFTDANTFNLDKLTASGYGVKFTVYYDGYSQSIYGYPDVPRCPKVDGWRPGAPAILIPMTGDCAFVDIKNRAPLTGEWDGNWSRVTSNGEPVLLHYGDTLIANPNGQSTDPDDYRAVPTDCY